MHLVGFIVKIYYDARSSECQTKAPLFPNLDIEWRVSYHVRCMVNLPPGKETL